MGRLGELWYRERAGIHVLSGYCERHSPNSRKGNLRPTAQPLATIFPADAKTADNSVTVSFGNAGISNHGTLIAQSGKDELELTYYGGASPKIQGWFYYWATKGTFEVSKK